MLATMVATRANRLHRHRLLHIGDDGRVVNTQLKPQEYKDKPEEVGLVNVGFVVLERDALGYADPDHSTDWSGLIDPLCDDGKLGAYVDPGIAYFNVGTPEEYYEAGNYLKQYTRAG